MDRTQAKLLRALMKEPLNFWQLAGKQDDALRGYVDALTTLKNSPLPARSARPLVPTV